MRINDPQFATRTLPKPTHATININIWISNTQSETRERSPCPRPTQASGSRTAKLKDVPAALAAEKEKATVKVAELKAANAPAADLQAAEKALAALPADAAADHDVAAFGRSAHAAMLSGCVLAERLHRSPRNATSLSRAHLRCCR